MEARPGNPYEQAIADAFSWVARRPGETVPVRQARLEAAGFPPRIARELLRLRPDLYDFALVLVEGGFDTYDVARAITARCDANDTV
jgi:hypothetical protein